MQSRGNAPEVLHVPAQQFEALQGFGPRPDPYPHLFRRLTFPAFAAQQDKPVQQPLAGHAWPRLPHARAGVAVTVRITGVAQATTMAPLRNRRRAITGASPWVASEMRSSVVAKDKSLLLQA